MQGRSCAARVGFDGLIMTDDISMKALVRPLRRPKPRAAIRAGVDVILHCHGIIDEMVAVAGAVPDPRRGHAPRRAAVSARREPAHRAASRSILEAAPGARRPTCRRG